MVPRQRLRHKKRLEIGQPGPHVQVNQSHHVPAIDSGDAAAMAPCRADSGVLFRGPRALPGLSHSIGDLCSRFPCLRGSRLYGDCCRIVLSDCSISAGCRWSQSSGDLRPLSCSALDHKTNFLSGRVQRIKQINGIFNWNP